MTRFFYGVAAMVGLLACGAQPETESALLSESAALSPGAYQMTAPALDGYPCTEIAVITVTVALDGTEMADACPQGWSCAHDSTAALDDTYSATLPKSGGTTCSYDVTAASFEAAQ